MANLLIFLVRVEKGHFLSAPERIHSSNLEIKHQYGDEGLTLN